jgi:hypothetical protein
MHYLRGQQIMKYKLHLFLEGHPEEGVYLWFSALKAAKTYARATKMQCPEMVAVIEIVE